MPTSDASWDIKIVEVDVVKPIKKILVLQHQFLYTYDEVYYGYISHLPSNYNITKINTESDLNKLSVIVKELVRIKPYDLILSLGTLASTNLLKHEKETPVLITALASPEYSGLLTPQ